MPPARRIPDSAELKAALERVHDRHAGVREGAVATYIPELAKASPGLFGICACTVDGEGIGVGDAGTSFTMQSISKPFVYALALEDLGAEKVHEQVDIEPTGDAFNAIRLDGDRARPSNPMVNAGAIAITGMILPGAGKSERLQRLLRMFCAFTARPDVDVDSTVFVSERNTGHRNRALAHLLRHFERIGDPVDDTLELYFQQCSVLTSCQDLSVMAATLANGGVNPISGARVLDAAHVEAVLSVMFSCGLYDHGGQFALEVGLPAKSGVSGGILAVVPGVMGIGVYSPPLDAKGNSVRGVRALRDLSDELDLHVFAAPEPEPEKKVSEEDRLRADLFTRTDEGEQDGTPPELVKLSAAISAALDRGGEAEGGANADYIQDLASVDPTLFGVAACTVSGAELAAGDVDHVFTMQSAANPFTFGVALAEHGLEKVLERVGVEPSANPYHAVALDRTNRPFNPMVNAGAIATCSLLPGAGTPERLGHLLSTLAACAGVERLGVNMPIFLMEQQAGHRNRAIASLLRQFGVIDDERGALELYHQQCAIGVTTRQLARMGATLANRGVNPITGAAALPPEVVRQVVTVMSSCGLHDDSGRWAFEVGIPAKSGISGAIIAVVPGVMGLAAFSPPVDSHGNSVRGFAALRAIADALDVGVFDALAGDAAAS